MSFSFSVWAKWELVRHSDLSREFSMFCSMKVFKISLQMLSESNISSRFYSVAPLSWLWIAPLRFGSEKQSPIVSWTQASLSELCCIAFKCCKKSGIFSAIVISTLYTYGPNSWDLRTNTETMGQTMCSSTSSASISESILSKWIRKSTIYLPNSRPVSLRSTNITLKRVVPSLNQKKFSESTGFWVKC